jgi:hypothetical protein
MTKDIFTQALFDYGSIQLFVDETNEARLQLTDGDAYSRKLVARLPKEAAFLVYNNCSVSTYKEMKKHMFELRARYPNNLDF